MQEVYCESFFGIDMFVDRVTIEVKAGKGGNGRVAWRREKYIPKGGPSGGDGGRGGNILIAVDPNVEALDWFKHTRLIHAENGGDGQSGCKKGKDGQDIILRVPPGTEIRDSVTRELLYDLNQPTEPFVLCQGGKGGKGNFRFRSSTNRAPNIATDGVSGEERTIELELKLIADVGLVGFPNAGKSTLLSVLCHRQVKTAPYPFTTLVPNLGFVSFKGHERIVIADIPGIIEGAHDNRGLGLDFLRHIERTSALLYVIDAAGIDGRAPLSDYHVLRSELEKHNPELLERDACVILNKMDVEGANENAQAFVEANIPFIFISCTEKTGLDQLKAFLQKTILTQSENDPS